VDNGNTSTHLDKLLEGKPPEFQNKVLRFAYDSGMKPNDPAFQFVQYVGFFAAIAENAPHEWRNLFNDVYQHFQQLFDKQYKELDKWTDLTEEQLKNFHRQTEIIKELALSCNKLGDSLRNLEQISQQQIEQFKSLDKLWIELKLLKSEISELRQEAKLIPEYLKPVLILKESLIPESENPLRRLTQGEPPQIGEKFSSGLLSKMHEKILDENFLTSLLNKIEKLKPQSKLRKLQDKLQDKPQSKLQDKPQKNRLDLNDNPTLAVVVVVVGLLGFMGLSSFLGWQIGSMQVKGDRDYQQAMEIWEWNRDQIEKAKAQGRQKTTTWIVPEYQREKK
jgi:hypothetical protein